MNKQLSKWHDRPARTGYNAHDFVEWSQELDYERRAHDRRWYARMQGKLIRAIRARQADPAAVARENEYFDEVYAQVELDEPDTEARAEAALEAEFYDRYW